ncbi:MAG: hypothetical protein RIA63_03555 [Cyclobacteriaceae bacterium]
MKKVMVLVLCGLMGLTITSFGQDRQTSDVRAQRVDRVTQARLQQARIKQARLDQTDLSQQRIEQARIKQARLTQDRIKDARLKDKRIKDARLKNKRIKDARLKNKRIKDAREDAASDDGQVNRRRYHKAKLQAKRKRLANQNNDEDTTN